MTTNNTTETKAVTTTSMPDWWGEVSTEVGPQRENPLKDYSFIKVYNPMMGSTPDPSLDLQLMEFTNNGERIAIGGTIDKIKVLAITKCYEGFGTRYGDDNKPIKDPETGRVLQDQYFTPEVSVYDKTNIPVAKRSDGVITVLGKGPYTEFSAFSTSMQTPDGKINPMFNEIKTNMTTGEKYPTSIFKLTKYLYFKHGEDLFKMKLGASYGNWKDPKQGTFIAVENEAKQAVMKLGMSVRFEPTFITMSGVVKKSDKFNYVEWNFDEPTMDNISADITKCKEDIEKYNISNFEGIDLSMPYEALPYEYNKLILETTDKVGAILETTTSDEVSVKDAEQVW